MGIDKGLKRQGYEFDNERTERNVPTEAWINSKAGLAVRLQRFRLKR